MMKNEQNIKTKKAFQHKFQMPQTDFPNSENPLSLFKHRQKLCQEKFIFRIGIKVLQVKQFQDDYISFLAQLLMCESQFLKAFLIQPKYFYIQINMSSQQEDMSNEQINVQGKILSVLNYSAQVLNKFIKNHLSEEQIISQGFDSQKLINQFQEKVITQLKKNFKETFQKSFQ